MSNVLDEKFFMLENKLERFLKEYHGEPIALYGAGVGLTWYIELAQKYQMNIVGIIDSNSKKEKLFGYINIPLDILLKKYDNLMFIISAPSYVNEIEEILSKHVDKSRIYSFDASIAVLQKQNMAEYRKFLFNYRQKIEEFYSELSDEKSRYVFDKVLRGWLTYDIKYFNGLSEEEQYFPQFICDSFSNEEVFVDVGAYIGDSVIDFIKHVDGRYKKIYAFEPDKNNLKVFEENICDERIHVFQAAVSDKNGVVYFVNEKAETVNVGAHISAVQGCGTEINAVALDNIINEKITYLKMDIEGSELAALKGSMGLIKKYRPKLAICIYHKMEDIIEIPHFINSLGLGYKMYVRHHLNCIGTELVLYCL